MRFFSSQNNTVVAVISEEHAKLYGIITKAGGDPIKAGVRVFTFCRPERYDTDSQAKLFYTGTYDDLKALIKNGGHTLTDECGHDWSGFVPFSNGEMFHDRDMRLNVEASRYVCNLTDVLAVFGADALKSV